MKTLNYIAISLIILGLAIDFMTVPENLTGMYIQIIGLIFLIPSVPSFLKKAKTSVKKGDMVQIGFWKRIKCGTDEESTEYFEIKGIVDEIDACALRIIKENSRVVYITKSKIEKIKFL